MNKMDLIYKIAEEVGCGSIPSSNGIFIPAPNLDKFVKAYYLALQKEIYEFESKNC